MYSQLVFIISSVLPCIPVIIGVWLYQTYASKEPFEGDTVAVDARLAAALLECFGISTIVLPLASPFMPFTPIWFAILAVLPIGLLLGIRLRSMDNSAVVLALLLGSAIIICDLLLISMFWELNMLCNGPRPYRVDIPWVAILFGISSLVIFALVGLWSTKFVPGIALPKLLPVHTLLVIISMLFVWYVGSMGIGNLEPTSFPMVMVITYMIGVFYSRWYAAGPSP